MTAKPLLPFRSARTNRLFTCVVVAAAGIATASLAATLDPAKADTTSASETITLPPAVVLAAADPATDPTSGAPRRFRGRDQATHDQDQKTPARPMIDKKLTNDQVKDIVEGRIAMRGNANLKVGKITPKEDGVVNVEVTTKTGALVEAQEISTRTGRPAKAERRFAAMRERFRNHRMAQGGPGMMRHRGGERAMARGPGQEKRGFNDKDLALNADQAKKLAEAQLIMRGNPHLKVGAVKEKDADTISVDIVAADNSLVTQQFIDRHTGRPQRGARS